MSRDGVQTEIVLRGSKLITVLPLAAHSASGRLTSPPPTRLAPLPEEASLGGL